MKDIKELIYDKYIKPTETDRETYVGVEIEIPIVNLSGEATSHNVSRKAFNSIVSELGLKKTKFDNRGYNHEALNEKNGDLFSFDCSYNNLEISFGKETSLIDVNQRLKDYIRLFNRELGKENHILTGLGIQPYYKKCRQDYIDCGRYKMLEGFLRKADAWKRIGGFHKYPGFGTFASATQLQLDVKKDNLAETLRVFSLLEPLKAVLFANSDMPEDEPDLILARDMLWEYSTHGINPHNIGIYDVDITNIDALIDYISTTSIFCAERDKRYIFFRPVPFAEYATQNFIEGEFYKSGEYQKTLFVPDAEKDIKLLRSYKFLDLTARGTIEYRSMCTQPLSEALAGIAFQLGLASKLPELDEILSNDKVIYGHSYNANELRRLFSYKDLPAFVERDDLRALLLRIVKLSEEGLKERGLGEESLLAPVYDRADRLSSAGKDKLRLLTEGKTLTDIITSYAQI